MGARPLQEMGGWVGWWVHLRGASSVHAKGPGLLLPPPLNNTLNIPLSFLPRQQPHLWTAQVLRLPVGCHWWWPLERRCPLNQPLGVCCSSSQRQPAPLGRPTPLWMVLPAAAGLLLSYRCCCQSCQKSQSLQVRICGRVDLFF